MNSVSRATNGSRASSSQSSASSSVLVSKVMRASFAVSKKATYHRSVARVPTQPRVSWVWFLAIPKARTALPTTGLPCKLLLLTTVSNLFTSLHVIKEFQEQGAHCRSCGQKPEAQDRLEGVAVPVICAGLTRRAATAATRAERSPGDFDFMPPVFARPGKTLFDATSPVAKVDAKHLLRSRLRKGMISEQWRGGWPKNVCSVDREQAFQAQLESSDQGMYHGVSSAVR